MVIMAACESGLTDFQNLPNESFGLPRSFLMVGAVCVVGTMWPVDDDANHLFVSEFHRLLRAGESATVAFYNAQKLLREGQCDRYEAAGEMRFSSVGRKAAGSQPDDYANVYYWGGFSLWHR